MSFNLYADDYKKEFNNIQKINKDVDYGSSRFLKNGNNSDEIMQRVNINNLIDSENTTPKNTGFLKNWLTTYNHNGLYVFGGISGLYSNISVSGARHSSNTAAGISFPQHNINTGFYIALGARSAPYSRLFFSLEGFYHMPNTSNVSNWYIKSVTASNIVTNVNLNSKLSINHILGVKLKAGLSIWRFNPYGTIGYAYSMGNDRTYESAASVNSSIINVRDSSIINSHGIVYGGGVEFLLTDNIIFRAEYTEYLFAYSHKINYTYQGSTYPISDTANSSSPKYYSDKVRMSYFMLGIAIKF